MTAECRDRAVLSTAHGAYQKKRGVHGIRAGRTCSQASPLRDLAFSQASAKRLVKYLEIDIPLIIPPEDASLETSGEI